jgi:uncharacterized membrane protein YGL010W
MVNIASISVLVVGVLIGATAAGVLAHTMNYIAEVDKGLHWGILFGYVLILSVGMTVEYGRPVVNVITSFVGIVVIGGWIFEFIKHKLPRRSALQTE